MFRIFEEALSTLKVPGQPEHKILREELILIMSMRNVSICNKTRLIVQKATGSFLYAMNSSTNKEVIFPKFELKSDVKKLGIVFKRRQLLLAPAFTIFTLKV